MKYCFKGLKSGEDNITEVEARDEASARSKAMYARWGRPPAHIYPSGYVWQGESLVLIP